MRSVFLVVNQVAKPYGSSRVALSLAGELAKQLDVIVVTSDGDALGNRVQLPPDVSHVHLRRPAGPAGHAIFALRLAAVLWRARRDPGAGVIGFLTVTNFAVRVATFLNRWRGAIVLTEHNIQSKALLTYGPKGRWLARSMRWMYNGRLTVVGVSKAVVRDLTEQLGIAGCMLVAIYNPVDGVHGQVETPTPLQNCQSPEASVGTDDFVCVAELKKVKRHDILISAMKYVRTPGRLVLLGDGAEEVALRRLAHELQVDEKVVFLGRVERPWEVARCARASLLVPAYEGFGLVAVESAVHGVRPIGLAVDGLAEVLDMIGGDIVVDSNNPEQLARNVAAVLDATYSRPWAADKMGLSAFDSVNVARKYLAVLKNARKG
jgi:glycosyltransferase involved in cell wall biosynthesis